MNVVIIIPTYNERDNIVKLIPEIASQRATIKDDINILIVDDNSPDGTQEAVKGLMKEYPFIYLITGKKQGLGRAYIRGMTYARDVLKADAVMEMDADFSHKPADIPRMLSALKTADFVIGSRYVPGGKIPPEWTLFRKMNSKFGNLCARYIAGIYRVKDCTAGFRAIRSSVLKNIGLQKIKADGYCFQIILLHEALLHGATIKEIPVEFIDRTVGTSKLGLKDIIEFLILVWMIRLTNSKVFIKFLIVGVSGVIVNLVSLTLFLQMGMNKFVASPISIELSIISNFILNNFWTFKWRKNQDRLEIRGIKFNIVSMLSLSVSYAIFILLSECLPEWPPQLPQLIGIVPATIVNYFLNSYWTFKREQG